ncbi:hypothetical protein [Neorhodopirellula pilleata]|uniref:Uncharacterized protein n=1 Tax=Neorhodopirellula pilleata TaxID=2714738 RepID=A0A5C6ABI3_9BACT|nr:hypothetical protein [Neorhodopirellula pilleata]TWT95693.1 hypothetical protein Pla100_33350 [Neorhodopirellula pilleata]
MIQLTEERTIFAQSAWYPENLLDGMADLVVLADAHLAKTGRKRWSIRNFYEVDEIFGPSPQKRRLITSSLFYAPSNYQMMEQYPESEYTRPLDFADLRKIHVLRGAKRKRNQTIYEAYVRPFLEQPPEHFDIRVCLPSNMRDVGKALGANGIQAYVMKSPSVGFAPGSCWRYLAMDDQRYEYVYVQDLDVGMRRAVHQRWRQLRSHPKSALARQVHQTTNEGTFTFILGNRFAVRPIRTHAIFNCGWQRAMVGYTTLCVLCEDRWCNFLGEPSFGSDQGDPISTYSDRINRKVPWPMASERRRRIAFPHYGFDEQFLQECVYYEATRKGLMLSILEHENPHDPMQRLDLETQRQFGNQVVRPAKRVLSIA